ncbi:hypothetical protein [Yoonia sp. SDW83-1]|uniref:hypothetical protein n=1 Tax=Yoonia sp. SDW83-1 TaxID=3366945 RepID=UPI00398C7B6F
MTALDKYVRLESGGLWRAGPDEQRRDVVVSFGDATLVISDKAGRPLTHWSLPAVTRQNPDEQPAIYTPDEDASEAVEIADEMMIDAIEQVRAALDKERPKPGKLRHWMTGGLIVVTLLLAIFWLPGALTRQTLAVVPLPKRTEIGATMLGHMQVETGVACREPSAVEAAGRLAERLFGHKTLTQIVVVPELAQGAVAIPGELIVLDHGVLQGTDDPAVAAGYVLVAHAARIKTDPLEQVLRQAGLGTTFRLLTTGEIPSEILQANAATIVATPWAEVDDNSLRPVFAAAQVPNAPYAAVIDADLSPDPLAGQVLPPILDDADWISLQNICNN